MLALLAPLLDLWSTRERTNAATSWLAMAGPLKHVDPEPERSTVFHEDGTHPSIEVGLRVADASKPGDELGVVLMVIEPLLDPTLHPT
jgi:hypothetical protein